MSGLGFLTDEESGMQSRQRLVYDSIEFQNVSLRISGAAETQKQQKIGKKGRVAQLLDMYTG